MQDGHDFGSSALREFRFKMDGKDYVLLEPDGPAHVGHQQALYKDAKIVDGKVQGLTPAEAEPVLVSGCLFHVAADGKRSQLTEAQINAIPARIMSKLYEKCKELGRDDDPKDEPSASTTG